MCVCVCEREREREREGGKERGSVCLFVRSRSKSHWCHWTKSDGETMACKLKRTHTHTRRHMCTHTHTHTDINEHNLVRVLPILKGRECSGRLL